MDIADIVFDNRLQNAILLVRILYNDSSTLQTIVDKILSHVTSSATIDAFKDVKLELDKLHQRLETICLRFDSTDERSNVSNKSLVSNYRVLLATFHDVEFAFLHLISEIGDHPNIETTVKYNELTSGYDRLLLVVKGYWERNSKRFHAVDGWLGNIAYHAPVLKLKDDEPIKPASEIKRVSWSKETPVREAETTVDDDDESLFETGQRRYRNSFQQDIWEQGSNNYTYEASASHASEISATRSSSGAPTITSLQEKDLPAPVAPDPSINKQKHKRIGTWMTDVEPSDHVSLAESTSKLSILSESITSTSTENGKPNIRIAIAKKRYAKAQQLLSTKNYTEAREHLQQTIEYVKSDADNTLGPDARLQSLQLDLAESCWSGIDFKEFCRLSPKARDVLEEVFSNTESSTHERATAAHMLAFYLRHVSRYGDSSGNLELAKEWCETSIQLFMDTLGDDASETYESIALMINICCCLANSDARIWADLLPDGYQWESKSSLRSQTRLLLPEIQDIQLPDGYILTGRKRLIGQVMISTDGAHVIFPVSVNRKPFGIVQVETGLVTIIRFPFPASVVGHMSNIDLIGTDLQSLLEPNEERIQLYHSLDLLSTEVLYGQTDTPLPLISRSPEFLQTWNCVTANVVVDIHTQNYLGVLEITHKGRRFTKREYYDSGFLTLGSNENLQKHQNSWPFKYTATTISSNGSIAVCSFHESSTESLGYYAIRVYDLELQCVSHWELQPLAGESIDAILLSSDEKKLLTASPNSIRLHNARTGDQILKISRDYTMRVVVKNTSRTGSLPHWVFSPDNSRFAVLWGHDHNSVVLGADTGTAIIKLEKGFFGTALSWTEDYGLQVVAYPVGVQLEHGYRTDGKSIRIQRLNV